MSRHVFAPLLGLWLAFLGPAAAAPDLPAAKVPLLEGQAPQIDGNLDDAAWTQAARIENFRVFGKDAVPPVETVAWITADDRHLYIAFRCEELPEREIIAAHTGRNGRANTDDSVEVFLGTNRKSYYHFVLGAGNAKYEQQVHTFRRLRKEWHWDVPWKTATHVGTDAWSAEMAIPLYIFGGQTMPPEALTFNLTRTRRATPRQFISWAPVETSFHDPDKFGYLTGLESRPIPRVFAPLLGTITAEAYIAKDGTYAYPVQARVSNRGGKGGQATLVIEETLADGATRRVTRSLDIPPVADNREVTETIAVEAPVARTARAWIATDDDPEGEPIRVTGTESLTPFDVWPDRNMYTRETHAHLHADTIFDADSLRNMRMSLAVTGNGDASVFSSRADAANGRVFSIPITTLPVGLSRATVTLSENDGKLIGEKRITLERFASAPDGVTEAKLDQVNECILLNGKPWFPHGFIMYSGMTTNNLKTIAAGGFDTVVRWWVVGGRSLDRHLGHVEQTLDAAQELGLKVFDTATGFAPSLRYSHPNFRKHYLEGVDNLSAMIEAVGRHPALVGYYGLDEPGQVYFDLGKATYDKAHELDPYHLMYSSGHSVWPDEGYDIFDLLGIHGYWDPATSQDNKLMRRVAGMAIRAARHHRPFVATPQTDRGDYTRNLTPREHRSNLYVCLIQGAKGIIYFRHPVYHPAFWQTAVDVCAEFKALAPTLLTKSPPQNVEVNLRARKGRPPLPPGPAAALAGFKPIADLGEKVDLPLVQVLVKDRPEGGEMMLAANVWRDAVDATFTANFLEPDVQVRDFFTGKVFPVEEGALTDHLEPFAVRVYVVEGSSRKPGSVARVGINLKKLGEPPDEEDAQEEQEENLVRNPGFENDEGWTGAGNEVTMVETRPHSGRRCLQLDAPQGDKPHARVSQRIPVEAGRKYDVGVWVRSRITEGAEPPVFYFYGLAGMRFSPEQEEWTLLSTTVRAEKDVLLVGPHIGKGTGSIWVDDVYVRPVAEPETPNQIVNGSFEQQTYPGWPDNWGGFQLRSKRMRVFADGKDAYHGSQSLVAEWNFHRAYYHVIAGVDFPWKDRRPDVPYTVSFAIKAVGEPIPVEAWFTGGRGGRLIREVMPTAEWTRHTWTLTIPKDEWDKWWHGGVTVGFRPLKAGRFRVDAVQFEEGPEATDFVEGDYKAPSIAAPYRTITTWDDWKQR